MNGTTSNADFIVTVRDTSNRIFQNVYRYSTVPGQFGPTYVGWSGWSIATTNATAAPGTFPLGGTAGGVTFTPKTDGKIYRRTYTGCSSTTSGCLGAETAISLLPATTEPPSAFKPWSGASWLMVRAADHTVEKIEIDASGNVVAGTTAVQVGNGLAYSAPIGTTSFGTWWLYSTAADREVSRF